MYTYILLIIQSIGIPFAFNKHICVVAQQAITMYLMYNPFRFNDKYLITISKEHEDDCHCNIADVFPVIIF